MSGENSQNPLLHSGAAKVLWQVQEGRFLQFGTRLRRHMSLLVRCIVGLKVIANLSHGDKLDAPVAPQPADEAAVHEQDLWPSRDVWVTCYGEDEVVILFVQVREHVHPYGLDILGPGPAVGVGHGLDEHHGRQVV